MQTTVLFYDGEEKLLHKNDDFLYFWYATQEQWDAGEEKSGQHCSWIDISEGKGAEDAPYTRFHVTCSGTRSLRDCRVLRITGSFDGTELKPATMDY